MERRNFVGRLALTLGAVLSASTSALSALVPSRSIEKNGRVRGVGKWSFDPVTGEGTPLNDFARQMHLELGRDHVKPVIERIGLPKDSEHNMTCLVYFTCYCGYQGGCSCIPSGDMPACGSYGGVCSCCKTGTCCQCIYSGGTACYSFCGMWGCNC